MKRTRMKGALAGMGVGMVAISCGGTRTEESPVPADTVLALEACTGSDLEVSACEIKQLSEVASNISSIYSGAQSAIKILQLLGLMDSPATQQQLFDQLDSHLSRLGVSLGDQNQASYRGMYMPNAIANGELAKQLANVGRQIDLADAAYRDSRSDAIAAEAEVAFQRIYGGPYPFVEIPNWPPAGQVSQSSFIPPRDTGASNPPTAQTGDLVYDWRLGLPELMQTIAYRIAVLSSADPEWGTTHLRLQGYDAEMLEYRTELLKHLSRMEQGVKCIVQTACSSHAPPKKVWCEDVYTGDYAYYLSNCSDPTDLNAKAKELTYQLWQRMPLFEMRRMIDTLYLYANPAPDLAAVYEEIPLRALPPSLCLDIAGGNPMQIQPCFFNTAQWWTYTRSNGVIVNPATSMCLEVPSDSSVPGAAIALGTCQHPAPPRQQWTYDPEGGALRNGLYTVLDVQQAILQPGTPVTTWEANGGLNQQWRAENPLPSAPNPPSECGRLKGDEGLTIGQSLSSCDGRFTLSLTGSGDLSLTENSTGAQLWDTATGGLPIAYLRMQGDGNLVLLNNMGGPVWHSNTWGNPGAVAVVQDDANLVVYDTASRALFASNTCCR